MEMPRRWCWFSLAACAGVETGTATLATAGVLPKLRGAFRDLLPHHFHTSMPTSASVVVQPPPKEIARSRDGGGKDATHRVLEEEVATVAPSVFPAL